MQDKHKNMNHHAHEMQSFVFQITSTLEELSFFPSFFLTMNTRKHTPTLQTVLEIVTINS